METSYTWDTWHHYIYCDCFQEPAPTEGVITLGLDNPAFSEFLVLVMLEL